MTDATIGHLDRLIQTNIRPQQRGLAWLIMVGLAAFVVWSCFAELEQVSVAEGDVVPQSRLKTVQHLEGGIIAKMFVQEGMVVKEGDELVQLELGASTMNRDEIQVRIDSLMLNRARLQAETSGKPLVFPEDIAARRPDLVRSERQAYEARVRELDSVLGGLNDQARQRELGVRELEATRRAKRNDLTNLRERLNISEGLLKNSLTPRTEHLSLRSDVERLEGEISTLDASVPRAAAAISETRQRINEERAKFQRRAYEELAAAELNYARTAELLTEASDQKKRTLITSPIDGVVKNMKFATLGGVVRPGEAIMEIVPTGDRLVIEAKLLPSDRGYVQVGQPARVKISSYDFIRYGALEGKVTLIAPDTSTDQRTGQPYYRVVVETDKAFLGDDPSTFIITPGMQAVVDIQTGHRSVAFYLMKPVLKLKNEAFRER